MIDFIVLKHNFAFQQQIKLFDFIAYGINFLIFEILFKLEVLNEVAYLLSQGFENRKVYDSIGHFVIIHSHMIYEVVARLRVLNLNENCSL